METCHPTKAYLFVGGPADGQRIEVGIRQREWLVPEYEPMSSPFIRSSTASFAEFKPLRTVRYERKYISFGVSGEEILQVFGVAGVPIRDIIEALIAGYKSPVFTAP